MNLKKLSKRKELFTSGHRLCAGCGAGIMVRQAMLAAAKYDVAVASATGCLEVASTIFPYSAWKTNWFHCAFENAAATASGMEAAYKALKRRGKAGKNVRFIVFAGDGGTYDIGLQSLSGAMERGHRMLVICYNNEAYMNTGVQRSSATPKGAHTTTSPHGSVIVGKIQERKDLTACLAAHHLKYAAQSAVGFWDDFMRKVETALEVDGPTFINVYTPCRLGWGFASDQTVELGRLAVETGYWPLYEVIDGKYKINYQPKKKKPLRDFLTAQERFRHLKNNKKLGAELQRLADRRWEALLKKAS